MINYSRYINLSKLLQLDPKIRICLRFTIETSAAILTYLLWLMEVGGLTGLTSMTHAANFVLWCFLYASLGLHRDRIRFSSLNSYIPILKVSIIFGLILWLEAVVLLKNLQVFAPALVILTSSNILIGFRILARQVIRQLSQGNAENVLVYGTSDVAIDVVNAMTFSKKYKVVAYIAETPEKQNSLSGLPVIKLTEVEKFAEEKKSKLVILANEKTNESNQINVLKKLDELGLSVSYAPTMDRAFDYEVKLKAVKPEDVLGRSSELKFDSSIDKEINCKTILVTGAGGSIGSELCHQVLRYQPSKLIVLELSELALYSLKEKLSNLVSKKDKATEIVYLLGSVTDEVILKSIFNNFVIDIVYHAAAYKHVPMIEDNVAIGILNNVFGTRLLADLSNRHSVTKFVFVSTDKAVRPTNVMGASKRLAELIVQDFAEKSNTIFTMVRFGNVLGSSGSVIPKFKSQINAGGPVTVTHRDITRYFMSIPEAAHLVLNAGTFSKGGEVFLLDMGAPLKILELARSMIRQHGLQPIFFSDLEKRKKMNNEIVIEFSGLRSGEKLYEELLIDGVAEATTNPKIFKSIDGTLNDMELEIALSALKKYAEENDAKEICDLLLELPIGYTPEPVKETAERIEEKRDDNNIETNYDVEKHFPSSFSLANQKYPTFFQRLVSSKIGLIFLHRYFLFTRGMTLGIRVLVQNQKGEILLVRHSYIPGWHLPGGGVEPGEDIDAAALREVHEETGISQLNDMKFLGLHFNSTVSKRDYVAYYSAYTSNEITNVSSIEISEVVFVSAQELKSMISPEYKQAIEKYYKQV